MPRLKHSIPAELPQAEKIDFAQIARDYAAGRCDLIVVLEIGRASCRERV